MLSVRGYYNGNSIIPLEPVNIPEGRVVTITFSQDTINPAIVKKLQSSRRVNKMLSECDEPLPADYDKVMSERVNIARGFEQYCSDNIL